MPKVDSSAISRYEYNPEDHILAVVWKNDGHVSRWSEVPPIVAEGLESASSKGRFLRANVIGFFKHERVDIASGARSRMAEHHAETGTPNAALVEAFAGHGA